jgi:AAA family ATPase
MRELGIQPKKGLLLYGPPGCSKTLTAKALATEAGLNFLAVKGAELLNQYVGESERALREVFRKAKSASPSILFFDEIDAIASARVSGQSTGLQVLTTLLTEMDGFEALAGVTILAATNKPETLDPALMRPGRLDEILYVGPPDLLARQEILAITSSKMWFDGSIDFAKLAEQMDGYSGAEIVNICQKAGYAALRAMDSTGYDGPILEEHLQDAMSQVKPQITMEVRTRYELWSAGREMKF